MSKPPPVQPPPDLHPWRELAAVAAVTVVSAGLSAHFEISEQLGQWLRRRETLQMDELPGVLLVLTCGLLWFAWRRYHDLALALGAHQRAEARLAEQLDRNRQLHLELLEVQERERRSIARELHDELGQYLGALRLDVHALAQLGRESSALEREELYVRAQHTLTHVHGTLREMIRRLRPVALDELGLAAALDQLVASWRQRMPETHLTLECSRLEDSLPETLSIAVFRIVQEALTNVARHSRAGLVQVRVQQVHQQLTIEVGDDGVGADPVGLQRGLGLITIAERVAALGGESAWRSAEGDGFMLWARVPMPVRSVLAHGDH
jgi:signal transduction histidine kinase